MDNDSPDASSKRDEKAAWRARLTEGRRAVSPQQQVADSNALAETVAGLPAAMVCAYVPFGTEPGSIALLDLLRDRGSRVLLPIVAPAGPLEWAEYIDPSSLVSGQLKGLLEPSGPRLGPAAIADADLVLVPAMAVDQQGIRLGKGAGHYDRSLPLATPGTPLLAVVRDTELVEHLPGEPHDVRMTGALTPDRGVVPLPMR